jgi:TRAP-type mannitol/chloroaromatic compound transport system permease large subunit
MDFLTKIVDFINSTQVLEQFKEVDAVGLFTNPWFLVPFIGLLGYMLYKQDFKEIIVIGIGFLLWHISGTEYMATLIVGDELQLSKVLPVVFGAACLLGIVIYMYFGKSD